MALLFTALTSEVTESVPPLVAGDVPTAERRHVEWYTGVRYQKTSTVDRQVPFIEAVYGLFNRLEVTCEGAYLSFQGHHGVGDIVLGTKYVVLQETPQWPGVAASFEWKLDNGNQKWGLGTGAMDYDLRLRSQKA